MVVPCSGGSSGKASPCKASSPDPYPCTGLSWKRQTVEFAELFISKSADFKTTILVIIRTPININGGRGKGFYCS